MQEGTIRWMVYPKSRDPTGVHHQVMNQGSYPPVLGPQLGSSFLPAVGALNGIWRSTFACHQHQEIYLYHHIISSTIVEIRITIFSLSNEKEQLLIFVVFPFLNAQNDSSASNNVTNKKE